MSTGLIRFLVFYQERQEAAGPLLAWWKSGCTGCYGAEAYFPEQAVYDANAVYRGYVGSLKSLRRGIHIMTTNVHYFVIISQD